MFNVKLSITLCFFIVTLGVFMKKYNYIQLFLFASMNYVAMAKQDFTNFEVKDEKKHLFGLVKCIEYGSTEVSGVVDSDYENWQNLSVQTYLNLRNRRNMVIMRNQRENYNICSRNSALLQQFLSERKNEEQRELHRFGYQLRSNELNIFPKGENEKPLVGLINQETGNVEEKQKASIGSGESALFPLPCIIIALDVKDNKVSNVELGYVASKMLQAGVNKEIVNDRYAMKMTILDKEQFEGKAIDLSSFFVQK